MNAFLLILELIGTVAFAISGAMTALQKNMDIFGVSILGLTAAAGGGVLRDILIGSFPPAMFRDPTYALVAVCASVVLFIPSVRKFLMTNHNLFDILLLHTDSIGLGVFTVYGVSVAIRASYGSNLFLVVFLGTVTGVGGGLLRDLLAGNTPYIFVKHIYACAAIAGALACALLWNITGETIAMISGSVMVVLIRLLAAHFRWSLPKARDPQVESE